MDRGELRKELPSGLAGAFEEMIAENLELAELIAEIAFYADELSGESSASSTEIEH